MRQLLRQYNEEGLASLRTRAHPERPPALTPEDESVVVEIATMPPRAFGQPFNQWSLRKLTDGLVNRQMIPKVSHVTIGKVLKRHKVTLTSGPAPGRRRRIRTSPVKKKQSTDSTGGRRRTRSSSASTRWGRCRSSPMPAPRGRRRSTRCDTGPPTLGTPASATSSAPTTSTRTNCGCITSARSTPRRCSTFFKAIRRRYDQARRIYLVLDNLSTHTTEPIRQWCQRNQVDLVFTATNASWMNRLECHLTAAHYFVIKSSDPEGNGCVIRSCVR